MLLVLVFLSDLLVAQTHRSSAVEPDHSYPVQIINPPVAGFYTKWINCNGISIRSSAEVDDSALVIACSKIQAMLMYMPTVLSNLIDMGVELHVIGKDQQTSDLPEWAFQKGKSYKDNRGVVTDIDKRTRGMGGIPCSCGEENLLNLPSDRYRGGSDICVHEFAHNIMNAGLDADLKEQIDRQYKHAIAKGLWKDAYAATNASEYWAELSMWYFGAHGEFLKNSKDPAAGPEGLRNYDADGYALLHDIYTGRLKAKRLNLRPVSPAGRYASSRSSGDAAELLLVNNSDRMYKVYWIDYEGNKKAYGDLPPFTRHTQSTYTYHVWLIESQSRDDSARIEVNSDFCVHTISR